MKRTTTDMLGTAPLGRVIWTLAVPTMVANLINCLYNIVDRIYIGRIPGVGTAALTGVGITFPIIMLVTAFANFAGSGGAPLAGIQLGAGNRKRAEDFMANSFAMLMFFGFSLTVIFQLFKRPLLYAFGASDAIFSYGSDYLSIYLWGTVFMQIALGMNPFIATQGHSTIAMLSVAVGAVLNIVLDPLFIFTFHMGVQGAALASVISQGASALWVMIFICSDRGSLRLRRQKPDPAVCLRIAALGLAPFIMGSTESLITIVFNSTMQKYGGDLYVGSITVLQSIMMIVTLPSQSVSNGTQPLISYNYGAGNYQRVREVFNRVLLICMGLTLSMSLATTLFSGQLARLFTDSDAQLIALCSRAGHIFFLGISVFGAQNACQASFVGLGQAKASLFAALLRKVILMVPLILLLPLVFSGDPMSVYWAEPVSDATASCVTLCLYLHLRKKLLPVTAAPAEKAE